MESAADKHTEAHPFIRDNSPITALILMILPAGSSTFNVLFYHIEFVWVVLLLNIDDMIGKAFINKAQASAVYVYLYLLHPTSFMAVHNLNSSVGVAFHKY